MNGLNQMIAQGVRPIQIESPLNQMAQVEQLRQAQQTNMLRQQQMAEMQRQQEQTAGLNRLIQEAFDPATGRIDEKKLVGSMAQGGLGSNIMPFLKQSAEGRKAMSEAGKASTESALERIKLKRIQLENITTPDGYVQWALSSFDDPALADVLREMGSTREQVIAEINQAAQQPNALQTLIDRSRVGSVKFEELLQQRREQEARLAKPELIQQNLGGSTRVLSVVPGGAATVVPGSVAAKTLSPSDQAAAQRAGGPERRLKQGERWNPQTESIEAIPGSDLYKRQRSKFTDEYSGANTVLERTSTSVKKIDDLLASPGFKSLFGGYTAYLTRLQSGKAADARTRLESLQSDFKALGKEIIAARGQSIGQITEREWPILEGLIDTLSPTLDENVARERLAEIKLRFDRMQRNVLDTYETEFENSQFYKPLKVPTFGRRDTAAPAAPGAGGVDMNNPLLR